MSARLNLFMSRRAWAAWLLAFCAVLLTSGCGPDYKARGVVKGKVTVRGKNLTAGTVMFQNKDGTMSGSGSIKPDGTYEITDAPVGECKVTVSVHMTNDPSVRARMKGKGVAMPEGPKDPNAQSPDPPSGAVVPKEVVPIDQKYADPETSGLKFTVQKGEQTYNIEL